MNDYGGISFLQIEVFLAVAESKSISAAAQKMYISHSAASRLINKLESCMKTKLLKRTNQGVELTESGEKLLYRIRPLFNRLNATFYDVGSVEMNKSVVRVGCLDSAEIFSEVKSYIMRCESEYSDFSVDLSLGGFHELREGLLEGKYDCVFTYSVSGYGLHNTIVRYCRDFDTFFIVPENSPAIEGDRLDYRKLSECTLHLYMRTDRYDLSGGFELDVCRAHGFSPRNMQYASDDPASSSLLMDKNGFAIGGSSFDLRSGVRLFKTEKPLEKKQSMVLLFNPGQCSANGERFVESVPFYRSENSIP